MAEPEKTQRPAPRRFPPWTVVILGLAIGAIVASWMGAALGGLLGVVIWVSRG